MIEGMAPSRVSTPKNATLSAVSSVDKVDSAILMIIAFHTPDDLYRAEAGRLKESLTSLGLRFLVQQVQHDTSWVRTTLHKASWIRQVREDLQGPLLYVDVDCVFHADPWPWLKLLDCDISVRILENGFPHTGTVFINDTPGARRAVEHWERRSLLRLAAKEFELQHRWEDSDQGVLMDILEDERLNHRLDFLFEPLEPCLARIFDRPGDIDSEDVVIEHLQASRENPNGGEWLERRRKRISELEA